MIKLDYYKPYNWQALIDFLAIRATPGVERVADGKYYRSIEIKNQQGFIEVSHDAKSNSLSCLINGIDKQQQPKLVDRIEHIFDLRLNPKLVNAALKRDQTLWAVANKNQGLRVPGCWDGFEIAVRAIVGQQISVAGATTVIGKIVQQYGQTISSPDTVPGSAKISHLFPEPATLAELDPESLPMPKARAETIARVAQAIVNGELNFNHNQEPEQMIDRLLAIKGIGPWTAQYIAMRALAHPDALLEGDLILEKKAARLYNKGDRMKTAELLEYAEKWRPWRAYAAMHIWNLA